MLWVETATLQEMKENVGEELLPAPYNNFPFYPLKYVNSLERTHYRLAQQQEDIDTKLDNLNLLYVALTRPQYRLYIITPANEKSIEKEGRETKVGDLLYGLITTNQGLLYTQVEAGTYTMGEAISYKETLRLDHKEEKEADNMHESVIVQPVEDWRNIIRVRTMGNQVFRSIKNDQDEKIQTGIMLHLALSKVRLPQDIGNALQALQHNGTLTSQQVPVISAKLKRTQCSCWLIKKQVTSVTFKLIQIPFLKRILLNGGLLDLATVTLGCSTLFRKAEYSLTHFISCNMNPESNLLHSVRNV